MTTEKFTPILTSVASSPFAKSEGRTLAQYLNDNVGRNFRSHVVTADISSAGVIILTIHPNGLGGEAERFTVEGNTLKAYTK